MSKNYYEVLPYFENVYEEVDGCFFYAELFPNNENEGEYCTDFSKPNAIYLYQDEMDNDSKRRLRRRIMLNDTWEEDYSCYVDENPMTLCSGLSYRQRSNKLNNAQRMHALIFDLDGVGKNEIINFFMRTKLPATHMRSILTPTYIALSGSGLHLYYFLRDPIDLYPNIKTQLKSLKYDLTFRFWDYKGTSQVKAIQYQSINQGFRMVGSINNKYGIKVRAFRTGDTVTLEQLNAYADKPQNRVDINKPFRPSKMSRPEAKEKFPEWYQRVVVEGNKNATKWDIASKQGDALYQWWKKRMTEIAGGHRYFYLMCLSIYAVKCDVPKKKLKDDMYGMFEYLKSVDHTNEFTEYDILGALETYDRAYYNYTITDIELLSGLRIERNRRNYQEQIHHLEEARAIRDIRQSRAGTHWTNNAGRPTGSGTKQNQVQAWKTANPNGKKIDCHKATGLSRVTINKWWNAAYVDIKDPDPMKSEYDIEKLKPRKNPYTRKLKNNLP